MESDQEFAKQVAPVVADGCAETATPSDSTPEEEADATGHEPANGMERSYEQV